MRLALVVIVTIVVVIEIVVKFATTTTGGAIAIAALLEALHSAPLATRFPLATILLDTVLVATSWTIVAIVEVVATTTSDVVDQPDGHEDGRDRQKDDGFHFVVF